MTDEDINKYCGRGLPWNAQLVSVGKHNPKRVIEDQAWKVGAPEAFESDIFGTMSDFLVQMHRRASEGIGRERSDMEFLDYRLADSNGREPMAGAMAKAAAPNIKQKKKTSTSLRWTSRLPWPKTSTRPTER